MEMVKFSQAEEMNSILILRNKLTSSALQKIVLNKYLVNLCTVCSNFMQNADTRYTDKDVVFVM